MPPPLDSWFGEVCERASPPLFFSFAQAHSQHSNGNPSMALGDRRSETTTAGGALWCARGRLRCPIYRTLKISFASEISPGHTLHLRLLDGLHRPISFWVLVLVGACQSGAVRAGLCPIHHHHHEISPGCPGVSEARKPPFSDSEESPFLAAAISSHQNKKVNS